MGIYTHTHTTACVHASELIFNVYLGSRRFEPKLKKVVNEQNLTLRLLAFGSFKLIVKWRKTLD
jgi:hypothetical protein